MTPLKLFLTFIIILTVYFALASYQLDLPGLHYDEAFEAVPALQLLYGLPVTPFRQSGLPVGGQTLPLMTQDYIGALNSYLALPFIHLLGPTPQALRLMSVLLGGITLMLAYLLTAHLTNRRWLGLLAALLLAVDPTFIFWNRQGIFVTSITAPIALGATYCWLKRLDHASLMWSSGGAFLLGLGLYAKFLFLWIIVALLMTLGGYALYKGWRQRKTFTQQPSIKLELIAILMAFLVGCWPLIVYNLQTGGTFISISENSGQSYYGVDNWAFGVNLMERLYQYGVLLGGGHLWYLGDSISNPFPPILLTSVVILFIISIAVSPTRLHSLGFAWLPIALISLTILASIGTVSALWITHYAILMPWWAIALVTMSGSLHDVLGNQLSTFTRNSLATLVMTLLVVTNLVSTISYHAALTKSGGLSTHSDAIYDLSDWLLERKDSPVAAMDWGQAAPIIYLTAGQVTPVEIFGYQWEADSNLTGRMAGFVADRRTLYLWRAPDEIIFDRSDSFKDSYRPLALEETIEEAFYERSGRPILGITRLVPQGTATNRP